MIKLIHILSEVLAEMPQITRQGSKVMADDQPLKAANLEQLEPNFSMYHEQQGNMFFPKGKIFLYFHSDPNWGEKVVAGEYDMLQFPYTGRYARFGAAPIKDIWKSSHTKNFKGSDKILGIIEAFEGGGEVIIQMMSVRPGFKKNRINSFMVDRIRKQFPSAQIVFEDPTRDGWAFIQKYAPDAEARSSSGKVLDKPYATTENFADGKKPGRKGLSKKVGVSQKMSISQLAKIAKTATGERKRMAQWNLNMKRGRKKK